MVDVVVGQDEQVLFLYEIGWVYVDWYLVCIEGVDEYGFANFIFIHRDLLSNLITRAFLGSLSSGRLWVPFYYLSDKEKLMISWLSVFFWSLLFRVSNLTGFMYCMVCHHGRSLSNICCP